MTQAPEAAGCPLLSRAKSLQVLGGVDERKCQVAEVDLRQRQMSERRLLMRTLE